MSPAIAARPSVSKNCRRVRSSKSRRCGPFTRPPTPLAPRWRRQIELGQCRYAHAVEARDQEAAVSRASSLSKVRRARPARHHAVAARFGMGAHRRSLPARAGCSEIVDAPAGCGSAGMAADVSEIESMRAALDQQNEGPCAHARPAFYSVAISMGESSSFFHNAAYRQLWASIKLGLIRGQPIPRFSTACGGAVIARASRFRAGSWPARAYQSLDTDEQVWFFA